MTFQKNKKKVKQPYLFHYKNTPKNHSRHYIKPYLPYLPIILIFGLGFPLSSYLARNYIPTNNSNFLTSQINANNHLASILAGLKNNNLIINIVLIFSIILTSLFIIRHLVFLKKMLIDSEKILLKNTWLDILIAIILTSSFVLLALK